MAAGQPKEPTWGLGEGYGCHLQADAMYIKSEIKETGGKTELVAASAAHPKCCSVFTSKRFPP